MFAAGQAIDDFALQDDKLPPLQLEQKVKTVVTAVQDQAFFAKVESICGALGDRIMAEKDSGMFSTANYLRLADVTVSSHFLRTAPASNSNQWEQNG